MRRLILAVVFVFSGIALTKYGPETLGYVLLYTGGLLVTWERWEFRRVRERRRRECAENESPH